MKESLIIKDLNYSVTAKVKSLKSIFVPNDNIDRKEIFKDYNLKVNKGVWLGISGTNGKGKTTLTRLVANIISPETGEIKILENYLCCMISKIDFYPFETVGENLKTLSLLWKDKTLTDEDLKEIISGANLEFSYDFMTQSLSTGQHKRLIISLAIFLNFDAYIWDETFSNINKEAAEMLLSKLKNKTCLFISHDHDFLEKHCHSSVSL